MRDRPTFIAVTFIALAFAFACHGDPSDSVTAPTPQSPQAMGFVQGVVRRESPRYSRIPVPPLPAVGAEVMVTAGAATGHKVVTDANGAYTLRLPQGLFRLLLTKKGFVDANSNEMRIAAGGELTVPDVVLRTAPWALAGVVTDSLRNPLPGATVTIEPAGELGLTTTYGAAVTGADGRYRLAMTLPHFDQLRVSVRVTQPGSDGLQNLSVECCESPNDTVFDIRVPFLVRLQMSGPQVLRVGELAEVVVSPQYDDGKERLTFYSLTSSDPSVLSLQTSHDSDTIGVRGVRPGVTTISVSRSGIIGSLTIQVIGP